MGIARPRRGHVRLRGDDITALDTHAIARRGIAWVPEERRVLPNLTVLENLRLGMLGGSGSTAPRSCSTRCSGTFRGSASASTNAAGSSRAASSRCSPSRAAS